MKAIEKGMRPGICDTRAHIPHIVFADYKNKTSAEVVQVLDTQLEEVETIIEHVKNLYENLRGNQHSGVSRVLHYIYDARSLLSEVHYLIATAAEELEGENADD